MVNQLVLILAAVFCIIPILNIILPDYYNYVVRRSFSTPVKQKYDFLYPILTFIEVIYILLGFTTHVAAIFILLIVFEVLIAVGLNIANKLNFYLYSAAFLVINIIILVELYEKLY